MPKKLPKPPHKQKKSKKHSSHKKHEEKQKSKAHAFLDEEICIEAKVTINPNVSIGDIQIECLEPEIEPKSKNSSENYTLYVNQLIRVKFPVRFSAKVEADSNGIVCETDESSSSDCSSSCSSDWT